VWIQLFLRSKYQTESCGCVRDRQVSTVLLPAASPAQAHVPARSAQVRSMTTIRPLLSCRYPSKSSKMLCCAMRRGSPPRERALFPTFSSCRFRRRCVQDEGVVVQGGI
ncbi:unnamed protein product, partial [Ectocarpus sp. 13 AM-2016]